MRAIIGRDGECATIAEVITSPGVGMLLIEGEPGIGKSTIWQYGVAAARDVGLTVLQARCGRAEQDLTYAGLAALLPDTLLDEVLPALPQPRRQALELALLRISGPTATPVMVGLAVASLLQELARAKHLVLAIDDLQWLDGPTAQVLEFALRRAGTGRVLVLGTCRTATRHRQATALEGVFEPDGCRRLTVGPLSVGALGALVRQRLGRTLPRLLATRLHRSCGGNPLLALELVRVLPPDTTAAPPGEPFPVSADALTLLGQRIGDLSVASRQALLIAALAAQPTLDLYDCLLGPDTATGALAELTSAELIWIDHRSVHCAHPLIASAAWTTAGPAQRRSLHRRLAAQTSDLEQRGRHLALSTDTPDERVAVALDEAAAQARQRGATDAAAELAELATMRTPLVDRAAAAARELTLARYRLDAGHTDEAHAAVARAIDLLPEGPERVDALLMRAAIAGERSDVAAARAAARQALAEAGGDGHAAARAHIGLAFWGYEDLASDLEHARTALDLLDAQHTAEPKTAATAMLIVGGDGAILAGRGIDLAMLDRAVTLERLVPMSLMERPSTHRAIYLGHAGRYRESISEVEACLSAAEAEGDWAVRPHLLRVLAWFEFCLGHFGRALARWHHAAQLADELGLDDAAILLVGSMVNAVVGGNGDELGSQALARSRAVHDRRVEVDALKAVGFCHLTRGEPAAAVGPLSEAAREHHDLGLIEPGWARLHADWIEAMLGVGDLDQARAATEEFGRRAVPVAHPWTAVAAARCRGLIAEAEGRPDEAIGWLRRSLAHDPAGELRFERARTLTALGRLHRRRGHRRA
ncbi:MAG TPA: ATP-binding protein, partial [Micromonosporaceae bacterium]